MRITGLRAYLVGSLLGVLCAAVFGSAYSRAAPNNNDWHFEMSQPSIDTYALGRVWDRLVREMNAPDHIKPPALVLDWHVPLMARMGFQYPNIEFPDSRMFVGVAPRTIDMTNPQMLVWGIGHEFTHFMFIMKENNFEYKDVYEDKTLHHCNPEFMRITRVLADEIWSIYHEDTNRARMYDEVIKSCANQPNQ